MAEENEYNPDRQHEFFAQATAFSSELTLPFVSPIQPLGTIVFEGLEPGYLDKSEPDGFKLRSAISFGSAYSQVAGNRDIKKDHGWSTLATAVVEGLNIFDVVTADRVVAQINTDHPLVGYVPTVTFIGTRFENLRIAGHPVKIELDLHMLGPRLTHKISTDPDRYEEEPYTHSKPFLTRVEGQHDRIRKDESLPSEIGQRYNQIPSRDECRMGVECSLIKSITVTEPNFPGHICGHVIVVPHFGVISLATLQLVQANFNPDNGVPETTGLELNMMEIRMGCLANGTSTTGQVIVKGKTHP